MNTKDPRFQKAFLGLLGLAGLLYVFFFTTWVPFTYKASASQLGSLEAQYLSMSKELNKARQATHRLPYLEREYQLLHRKWEQGASLLPENQDMAWVLRTVTLLGTQAGVQFTLFKPDPPRPMQYHTENPIEIKVVGGYHQIGSFLAEVANLNRIINVTNLDITTNKEATEELPAEASFVAVTYTLGGTGVPPQQEQAAGDQKDGAKGVKAKEGSGGKNKKGAGDAGSGKGAGTPSTGGGSHE